MKSPNNAFAKTMYVKIESSFVTAVEETGSRPPYFIFNSHNPVTFQHVIYPELLLLCASYILLHRAIACSCDKDIGIIRPNEYWIMFCSMCSDCEL